MERVGNIKNIRELRWFKGEEKEFWSHYLQLVSNYCLAQGIYLFRSAEESWETIAVWPNQDYFHAQGLDDDILINYVRPSEKLFTFNSSVENAEQKTDFFLLNMPFTLDRKGSGVALLLGENSSRASEVISRFRYLSDMPAAYYLNIELEQLRNRTNVLGQTLDLLILLNDETRFLAAVMTLCNEIANRLQCSRVSLGWQEGRYVRIQGMSHIERFEPKMDAVQSLEAAMEEALDQDDEIFWPAHKEQWTVAKSHEAYYRKFGSEYLVSLPLRLDNEPVGVLHCERSHQDFSREEIRQLRLVSDNVVRRLSDLKRQDRWFGARFMDWFRDKLSSLFGYEHAFAKLTGIVLAALLIILIFGHWSYRIESPCILKTDRLAYLQAPFKGYVRDVNSKMGDRVDKGDPLLKLDTRELLLKESSIRAQIHRFSREAGKARGENALAEMRIAKARLDQVKAELDRVQYHLNNAVVKAPFSGIVVEGERKELLGRPVHKGDVLFKVAQTEDIYFQLNVPENAIHEVDKGASGETTLLSWPDKSFEFVVERISPMAQVKEDGNVFEVRGKFQGDPPKWWRPGMSGVGKIDAGDRSIIWILTHKTIDFLRLHLWW